MPLGDILKLVKGSVIELEKLDGEPVEVLVNGHKIAQGDVVVIDEYFGVRISNLLASQEHIKELQ
jgi:flagellar motor switch protein FliN/FliY